MLLVAALIVMICVCLFSLVAIQRSMNIKNSGLLISGIKSQMADKKNHKWTEEEKEELRKKLEQYQKEKLKRFGYRTYGDGGCSACGG